MLGHKDPTLVLWEQGGCLEIHKPAPNINEFFFLPLKETKTRKLSRQDMGCSRGRPRALGLLLCSNRKRPPERQSRGQREPHRPPRLPELGKEPPWLQTTRSRVGEGAVFAALLTRDPFSWQGSRGGGGGSLGASVRGSGRGAGREKERVSRRSGGTPPPPKSRLHVLFPNSCRELRLSAFRSPTRESQPLPRYIRHMPTLQPPSYSHSQRPSLGAQPGWVAAKPFLLPPPLLPPSALPSGSFSRRAPPSPHSFPSPIANSPWRGNRGTGRPAQRDGSTSC